MSPSRNSRSFDFNKFVHENISSQYNKIHPEIFNEHESNRIDSVIMQIRHNLNPDPICLDFGCCTGNITSHFLSNSLKSISVDISQSNINYVISKFSGSSYFSDAFAISEDYNELSSYTFDLIYIYSVLHHIPDYLAACEFLAQLLNPGAFLVIDHEKNSNYFSDLSRFRDLYNDLDSSSYFPRFYRKLTFRNILHRLSGIFIDPRFQIDGDIHVWPDDHIDAHAIIKSLSFMELVDHKSYFGFSSNFDYTKFLSASADASNADTDCLILRRPK